MLNNIKHPEELRKIAWEIINYEWNGTCEEIEVLIADLDYLAYENRDNIYLSDFRAYTKRYFDIADDKHNFHWFCVIRSKCIIIIKYIFGEYIESEMLLNIN